MPDFEIVRASDLGKDELFPFLDLNFAGPKSRFIRDHAAWKYRGSDDSLAVVAGGRIAAYCAVIPAIIHLAGERVPTRWWVDLVVAPEYRGRGLQTLLDREIRNSGHLTLGFPNQTAAVLHRKHGWGVREDGRVLMLPLRPETIAASRSKRGMKGMLSAALGHAVAPAAAAFNRRFEGYIPQFSAPLAHLSPADAGATFAKRKDRETITTLRDEAHLRWRYLDCPNAGELSFFRAEPEGEATHLLIARTLSKGGMTITRILDLLGDFSNAAVVKDLVRMAIAAAARKGAAQVTAMVWPRDLVRLFRSLGFIIGAEARFCWYSPSEDLMTTIADSRLHWTIGDSDNDEPA